MGEKLIGRIPEKALLLNALESQEAELIAIYGRRRVGKTFLVRSTFDPYMVFECVGIHNAFLKDQLRSFCNSLRSRKFIISGKDPEDWLSAFQLLIAYLQPLMKNKKKVIFFDEFPWMHSRRSGFLPAFEHFWNSWASRQDKLIVVICGSAASWMIKNVIRNKGGLHNRLTQRLRLMPFTLRETELYFSSRNIILDRYQVLQLYLVMGGIPQYLREVRKGESSTKAIDRICFSKEGFLFGEFDNLFSSLFETGGNHLDVIRALAGKPSGLTSRLSFHRGYEGYVSFTSKSNLIEHYISTLGAKLVGNQLMIIDTIAASKLINKYFKE